MLKTRNKKYTKLNQPTINLNAFTYKEILTFDWYESDVTGHQIYSSRQQKEIANKKDNSISSSERLNKNIIFYKLCTRNNHNYVMSKIEFHQILFYNQPTTPTTTLQKKNYYNPSFPIQNLNPRNKTEINEIGILNSNKSNYIIENILDQEKRCTWLNYDLNCSHKSNAINSYCLSTTDGNTTNITTLSFSENVPKERLYALTIDELESYRRIAHTYIMNYINFCGILCCNENIDNHLIDHCKSYKRFKFFEQNSNTLDGMLNISPYECVERFGLPFPPSIYKAIQHLSIKANCTEGIFRRCGLKSRIHSLITTISNCPYEINNLRDYSDYDIADVVKRYIGSIPGTIFTKRFAPLFACLISDSHLKKYMSINNYPNCLIKSHIDLARLAIVCLPDEYREILQVILEMLKSIANNCDKNGMTIENLATCITPALFQIDFNSISVNVKSPRYPLRSKQTPRNSLNIDIPWFEDARKCCSFLIRNVYHLFNIPASNEFIISSTTKPLAITQLGSFNDNPCDNFMIYMLSALAALYEQHISKYRQWKPHGIFNNVPISTMLPSDNINVRAYRGYIDIDSETSNLIHEWNNEIHRSSTICYINQSTDIHYYRYMFGPFYRDFTLLRSWKYYKQSEMALIACTSIKMSKIDIERVDTSDSMKNLLKTSSNSHRFGIILAQRYLIEKIPTGCRVTYILRADLRGRQRSYYNRLIPYMISKHLILLKSYIEKYSMS